MGWTGWIIGAALALASSAGGAWAQQCPKAPLPDLEGQWALAVTWQPGFCQTYRPGRPLPAECPEASKLDRFTLHGLWPQWREYCVENLPAAMRASTPALVRAPCSVDRDDLPALPLSPALERSLARVMPGVRSRLERHEYVKHGTCAAMEAEAYFTAAIALVDALNTTPLQSFVAAHQGRAVTFRRFCDAIAAALGPEAVAAVEADSKRFRGPDGKTRHYLTELRFWLRPVAGRLGLGADHFVAVRAGTRTLGSRPANPLCDDHLDDHTLYIDKPGMDE